MISDFENACFVFNTLLLRSVMTYFDSTSVKPFVFVMDCDCLIDL